jgi:phage tail sheath gpL-like
MTITVQGLSSSRKTPGVYLAVVLGGVATSAGAVAKKILLLGNRISAALTGASPTFSTPAGTQGDADPVDVYSADDAKTMFGQGSELHRMALRVFS